MKKNLVIISDFRKRTVFIYIIGACYAGLYMVVNYAEGIVKPWEHEELAEIFYNEGYNMCQIIFSLLRDMSLERSCNCSELRKDTLLRKVYE